MTRIRKPGSARRAPVATAVRVLATSGVLISALALVGVGTAQAATGGHAARGSHTSAQSKKAGHAAKIRAAEIRAAEANRRKAPKLATPRPGPWENYIISAKGPWLW